MKRKVTYLVKYMDQVIKEVLTHTKNIRTQAELLKKRELLDEAIKKLEKKYDNIIKDIQNDIEEESPDEK
jgi:transposase-like protein